MTTQSTNPDANRESEPLIPGLPDEIVEQCLLQLPFPYQSLLCSISFSWNRALRNPNFIQSKKTLPHIFVFAYQKSTAMIQWQSFDPRDHRWFVLPPMPSSSSPSREPHQSVCPSSFASASLPKQGKLYVLGGMESDKQSPSQTLITYSSSTNHWSFSSPMWAPRAFFAAGCINDKIFAIGGSDGETNDTVSSSVECYDPKTEMWKFVARMPSSLTRYDSVVLGEKMYVTEGWTWPFTFSPRGWVYDSTNNTWDEMSGGMRDGWTGVSVVCCNRLFMISEHGDRRMKVYVDDKDTWQFVGGEMFPCEQVQRPFSVSSVGGKVYVIGCGLDVAVGSLCEEGKGMRVEWEVVKGPKAFECFAPTRSQVVYG